MKKGTGRPTQKQVDGNNKKNINNLKLWFYDMIKQNEPQANLNSFEA